MTGSESVLILLKQCGCLALPITVNDTVVDDWKQKLPTLCTGYDAKDIFNMDETGLFYQSVNKNTTKGSCSL
jgi:hypothetical protein